VGCAFSVDSCAVARVVQIARKERIEGIFIKWGCIVLQVCK
jgi:hypothetical protein